MKNKIEVRIKTFENFNGLSIPEYQTCGSAGMDIAAAVSEDVILAPGQRALIPSGFAIELPEGYEAQIRPRSGLAAKEGVTVLNSPGTIDSDYRGEIKIILINLGDKQFTVSRGMRIAQMVIAPLQQARLIPCLCLEDTPRGEGGFGHSGK